jgi:hypothetical protein
MGAVRKSVIHWNGKSLPREMKKVPPGKYILECLDDPPPLTKSQERGILKAMKQINEGRGIPIAHALRRILGKKTRR